MRNQRDHTYRTGARQQSVAGRLSGVLRLVLVFCCGLLIVALFGCSAVNGPLRFAPEQAEVDEPEAKSVDPQVVLEDVSPTDSSVAEVPSVADHGQPVAARADSPPDESLDSIGEAPSLLSTQELPVVQTSASVTPPMVEPGEESFFSPQGLTRAVADNFGEIVGVTVQALACHWLVRGALVILGSFLEPYISEWAAAFLDDSPPEPPKPIRPAAIEPPSRTVPPIVSAPDEMAGPAGAPAVLSIGYSDGRSCSSAPDPEPLLPDQTILPATLAGPDSVR